LAIAKWAVDVNGGHISVEAGANGGSVFSIALPAGTVPVTEHHEQATQRRGGQA
jgi:K+-sensing histidine kinase KdpD